MQTAVHKENVTFLIFITYKNRKFNNNSILML